MPAAIATTTAGISSRLVRARTARVDPSSGQRPHRSFQSDRVVRGVRRQDEGTLGRRPGSDPLREPLAVVLHEADRPLDHRRRAPVVDLEVDPFEPGQDRVQAQDPAHVGESPAIDGLVVVPDEQDPVRRCREQECEPQLRPIDVLDLVDEQVGAARSATLASSAGVALEMADRPRARGRRSRGHRTCETAAS